MDDPAVSVVIPTYNRARLVCRAIDSALAATATGDEIIVVDDGSTDGTEAALAAYRGRIRYVKADHRGAGVARNRGVSEARGPLIAFLDSDDEWMPDKLELQRTLMATAASTGSISRDGTKTRGAGARSSAPGSPSPRSARCPRGAPTFPCTSATSTRRC